MRIIYMFIVACSLISCSSQNLYRTHFRADTEHTIEDLILGDTITEYTLKEGDRVSISIWNHNDLSIGSVYGIHNSNEIYGKWVKIGSDSSITIPQVGRVKLIGLTILEAQRLLTTRYSEFLVNPELSLHVHGLQASVLGEVNAAGAYDLFSGQSTILKVISRAEGFTFYSNKKKVVLQRGEVSYTLDLTKATPYQISQVNIYPGDVIYVPQRGGKVIDKKSPNLIPFTSVVTTIALIISIIQP